MPRLSTRILPTLLHICKAHENIQTQCSEQGWTKCSQYLACHTSLPARSWKCQQLHGYGLTSICCKEKGRHLDSAPGHSVSFGPRRANSAHLGISSSHRTQKQGFLQSLHSSMSPDLLFSSAGAPIFSVTQYEPPFFAIGEMRS